jgi:hypothetical protein
MVNRHPERFSCIAVRGSNFNESLLNPAQVPKYRDMKIGIFFGENDFKVCREESMRAVEWYRKYRFDVEAKKVSGLGHERKPQVAAALFASTIGVAPKTPPELGSLVMMDVIPVGRYRPVSDRGRNRRPTPPPIHSRTVSPSVPRESPVYRRRPTGSSDALFDSASPHPPAARHGKPTRVPPASSGGRVAPAIRNRPTRAPTPKRPAVQPYSSVPVAPAPRTQGRQQPITIPTREEAEPAPIPARIRVMGDTAGPAPMWASLAVEMPAPLQQGASVLWTDNDEPIGNGGFTTQVILREPGNHRLEARITTADDRKIVLNEVITVRSAASQPAGS